MTSRLLHYYKTLVIDRPLISLTFILLLIVVAGIQATHFRLDASAESLVLEGDSDLQYFRAMSSRYAAQDFLFVTYKPRADILSESALADIAQLKQELLEVPGIASVVSILDVPLISSPQVSFSDLAEGVRTLQTPDVDKELARKEFLHSPLYRNLIMSASGDLTALQVNLEQDTVYQALLAERDKLRNKQWQGTISEAEAQRLASLGEQVKTHTAKLYEQQAELIAAVRAVMDGHRDNAELFLGGVAMITSDMVQFIKRDLIVFGTAILLFLIVTLSLIFRQARWVILPMLCCFVSAYVMLGVLGWMKWPVTVISSNFISLLLIITMSLTVHLIVRYRELHARDPHQPVKELVAQTVQQMAKPCFYTAITTIAAFASLIVSGIRPVIDFGYMMMVGISIAFLLSFVLFPATVVMLKKPDKTISKHDITARVTGALAILTERFSKSIIISAVLLLLLSVYGILNLQVENRFIDYFKDDTEIHQGMLVIDQHLGGTMPLDIIIEADQAYLDFIAARESESFDETEALFGDEEGLDDIELEIGQEEKDPGYWFNSTALTRLDAVHDYLQSLPQSGKVLSLATSMKLIRQINEGKPLDDLELAILRKKLPPEIQQALIEPYVTADGNETRISMRIIESDPDLRRDALIKKILAKLTGDFGFAPEQVRASNMLVLYNNMLQSLFRSQILTLGVVMLCIMAMFIVLFRSLFVATVAIIPNLMSAGLILGIMGIFGIPLDLMSITIAAITIGIAVDNAIHYIYRFRVEFAKDSDYQASVRRCHGSIGRAIYYTSLTIIVGFSILVLSNFIPTIYFGLLTALAMLIALSANLILLPRLLVILKPLSKSS